MAANDFYVDAAAGSDNNGGTSAGSAKVSGTAGATDGTATVDLSGDTPDLSSVVVGDCIRINGEAGGRRSTDLFEITAIDDGLDTVDVTPTPGTASGLTWAIGGAFATINRFMDTLIAADSDKAWIKGGTNYTETANIDIATAADSPATLEGYTTTPGDGGKFTIHGGSTRTNGISSSISSSGFYVFKNMRITQHTSHGTPGSVDSIVFKNCQFDNNGGSGAVGDDWWRFENCEFFDNTSSGCQIDTGGVLIGCRSYRNGGDGIRIHTGLVEFCVSQSNGGYAIRFPGAGLGHHLAINNTVDGDGKDSDYGIAFESLPAANDINVCVNNIIHDCTTGMESTSGQAEMLISRNNLLNDNTDDYAGGAATYSGEVLDAPGFVDEGSGDYRLTAASPAAEAGYDQSVMSGDDPAADIGAHQSGAGGGVTPPPLYPWHVGGA